MMQIWNEQQKKKLLLELDKMKMLLGLAMQLDATFLKECVEILPKQEVKEADGVLEKVELCIKLANSLQNENRIEGKIIPEESKEQELRKVFCI